MKQALKNKLMNQSTWLRLFYVMLFFFVLYLSIFIVFFIAFIQWVKILICGHTHKDLLHISDSVAQYISQCVYFILCLSEDKPYPFDEFPESRLLKEKNEVIAKNRSKKNIQEKYDLVGIDEDKNPDVESASDIRSDQ